MRVFIRKFINIIKEKRDRILFVLIFYLKYYSRQKETSILPPLFPYCGILRTKEECEKATKEVKALRLFPFDRFVDIPKNWDSLAALSIILRKTEKNASILDAGGEWHSAILPWLAFFGYQKLRCINLTFRKKRKIGPILYEYGNMTKTKFKAHTFDAITCLSVIEHGVNLEDYFKEVSRILKPGGIVITSTDYWCQPIDIKNKIAFGTPIYVFTPEDIKKTIAIAEKYNLELMGNIDFNCQNKTINWLGLDYTFIYFTLTKCEK